ncbi:MAG TPA: hypothetical protein VJ485_04030 [archaeon]|nr:hypothetical protein [archaeon]
MALFDNLVINMQNLGMFQYLFPFLLALAIFYGVLMWAIGDRIKKGPVGLISIVLAFFVMLYANTNPMIAGFFANLGGMTLIIGSGILVIAILLGLVGFKLNEVFSGKYSKWFLVFAVIIIGLIIFFGASGGSFLSVPSFFINSDFTTAIIVIVIIAVAMWFMTQGEGGGEKPKEEVKK